MAKKMMAAGIQLLVIDTENKFVSTGEGASRRRGRGCLPTCSMLGGGSGDRGGWGTRDCLLDVWMVQERWWMGDANRLLLGGQPGRSGLGCATCSHMQYACG